MPKIDNLPQKILLILSGAGFLAVGAWFLTDQGNRSAKKSIPPSDLPLDRELGEPLGTVQSPPVPLPNQSPGSLKTPAGSSPGLPLIPGQPKTKIPNIPSSPGVGITIPNQTLPQQPSQNFSAGTLPYIPPEPRVRSSAPSSSQSSTARRSSGSSYTGPGSLLPNIPDPLDKPQSNPAPKLKASPLPKSEPAPLPRSDVSPSSEQPKETSSTSSTKSSNPSYAPAAPDSSIKLAPSEFSEPEPLTPPEPSSSVAPTTAPSSNTPPSP
jgi:hypothetical protein